MIIGRLRTPLNSLEDIAAVRRGETRHRSDDNSRRKVHNVREDSSGANHRKRLGSKAQVVSVAEKVPLGIR